MATDFQTKEVQGLGTTVTDLTGAFTSGEVTVHAIYISNKHASDTIGFYLSLYDNDDTNAEKASILHNVEVASKSTLVIEKPINLTASDTGTLQRQLKVKASTGTDIDVVASVLVIT
jgi:hypothetical protein